MTFDDITRMMKTMTKEEIKAELMKLPVDERVALVKETCRHIRQFTSMFIIDINDIAVEHNLQPAESSKQEMLEFVNRLMSKK